MNRSASTNCATLFTPQTSASIVVLQPTAPHFVHPRFRLVSQCLNQLHHALYTPDSGLYRSTLTKWPYFVHPRLRLVSQCLKQLRHTLYTPDSGLYRSASNNCATPCTPKTPSCIAVPQPNAPYFVHPRLRLVSQCLNQLHHALYTPDSGLYRSASTNCATLCTPHTPACIAVPEPTAPLLTVTAALSDTSVAGTGTQRGR